MAKKKKKKNTPTEPRKTNEKFTKTKTYRFLMITLLYIVLGTAAFSWLVGGMGQRGPIIYILGGVFLLAYLLTIVMTEVLVLEKQGNLNKAYFAESWKRFKNGFKDFFKGE